MDIAALAALAGNALVAAAVTDAWEDVRHTVARIFGRGIRDRRIEEKLDATRAALMAGQGDTGPGGRADLAASWASRIAVLLEDVPEAAAEVEALVRALGGGVALASDHSVAAGRDVAVTASSGGVAAGVILGDVSAGPTRPGPVL